MFQKSLRAFLKHFFTVGSLWETASYTKEPLHIHFVQRLFIFHSVLLCTVNAAHRPGIIRAVLGVVAQVGDPCAVAVAGRKVHAVRCGDHLFQVALAVSQCLPQVQINAALACSQLCQLLVHTAQHIRCKAGLFGSFCPTGLTASAITQVAYTLADGTSVTLNAVSEPTESADSTDADSASSSAYETVWRLASDPAASLAQDKVQSLLSALCTYVTAQATDADLAACGFDAPVFTAAVTSEDGSTVQLTYACGTDGWYLQVKGDTSVYTVDTSTVQALLLTESDLKTQE